MRMTVSAADDPAAAKRARWVQNSARRHRLRALGNCSDGHPDVLVVLACVRLRGLAPAPVEQGLAADTRAAAGAALEPQTPVSVRMASAVCARAKDRISAVALAI